jgi:tetratricopeptide (TPR) repeat protein
MTGHYDQAARLFEESLDLNRKINDQGMVLAELQNLGWVEVHRGNVEKAERCFRESERLGSANDPYGLAMITLSNAFIAFARGDKNQSRTLFQRAKSMFKEAKMDPGPDDQFEINWLQDQLGKSAGN